MNIQVEELGMCQVQLTVEPDASQIEQAKLEVAKKYRKQVKVRGFRPGKAPLRMVMRALGQQQLINEVANLIIQDVFIQALTEANVQLYSSEGLHSEVTSYEPLTYSFTFSSRPVVKLGDLQWIKAEPKEVSVSDDQVYLALEDLRRRSSTVEQMAGPAQYGDQVIYDLRIDAPDGTIVANETDKRLQLTATPINVAQQPTTPINLSAYLVGLNVNEPHEFQLNYPENNGLFAGQTMTYHVTLKDLRRVVLPELNDEFAQKIGNVSNMDILREEVRRNLLAQMRRNEINRVNTQILNDLVDESEIEYPQLMLNHQIRQQVATTEQHWKNRGTTLEQVLKQEGKTLEEFEDDIRDDVEQELLRSLVLNQYVIANEISATEEELELELALVLSAYGENAGMTAEELKKNEEFIFQLTHEVSSRKGLVHLYTTIVGEAPPPLYDALVDELSNDEAITASEGEEVGTSDEVADHSGAEEVGTSDEVADHSGAEEVGTSNEVADHSAGEESQDAIEETSKEKSDSSAE